MMFLRCVGVVVALASCTLVPAAAAAPFTSPGAIAQLEVPQGFVPQYESTADLTLLTRGAGDQLLLIVGPPLDPRAGLTKLLELFGALHLAPQIVDGTIAGHTGVQLDTVTNVHERWYVLPVGGASLVIRAASTTSFEHLQPVTESVVRSIVLAPATYPPLVAGSYETNVQHSGSYDAGGPSVYSENSISLQPDGSVHERGFVGGSGDFGSVISESTGQGRWEVRGNRLLLLNGSGVGSNFRVQAFSNGLELYDEQGNKRLWVRK